MPVSFSATVNNGNVNISHASNLAVDKVLNSSLTVASRDPQGVNRLVRSASGPKLLTEISFPLQSPI